MDILLYRAKPAHAFTHSACCFVCHHDRAHISNAARIHDGAAAVPLQLCYFSFSPALQRAERPAATRQVNSSAVIGAAHCTWR